MRSIRVSRLALPALLMLLSACGAEPRGRPAPGFTDAGLFNRKRPPRPGEWLDRHTEHGQSFERNMNGSNSLDETDRQPLLLCPDCLKKLAWNRGFDLRERYLGLLEFYDAAGLIQEAEWVRRRLGRRGRLLPPDPDEADALLPMD